ncbi:MAG: DUF432 domain-containing protein [Archaeoglobaceae archaeon]
MSENSNVYGSYKLSNLNISVRDLRVWVEKDGLYRYRRKLGSAEVEKIFLNDHDVILNPVEPVNLPRSITNYLFIQFSKPIFVEPVSSAEVYLTFPIEIGVFVAKGYDLEDVDVFSFVKPKYALYGEPRGGVIARFWQSDVFSKPPNADFLENGIMKLKIYNLSGLWVEVNKVVFDVYAMKIYYSNSAVSSIAEMKIHSRKVAETSFIDEPMFEGMKKAIELYVARRIPILSTKFTMEWGL